MIAIMPAGGSAVGVPPPQWMWRTASRLPIAAVSRSISVSRVAA